MNLRIFLISIGLAVLATPAAAQLGVPQVNLPPTGTPVDPVLDRIDRQVLDELNGLPRSAVRRAMRLAYIREQRLERLVRQNLDIIEFDVRGEPARRGELLLIDASENALAQANALGFSVRDNETIDGLGIAVTRLDIPEGLDLADAQGLLSEALPNTEISADNLHFQSGSTSTVYVALQTASSARIDTPVGVVDGGAGAVLPASLQRGFATGAPAPSNHGSSVVSLLQYAGVRDIRLADVYGTDKAGGNALAIARAIGWLAQSGSRVINISLVGPENALVRRAIDSAQARGNVIVAAVGNDGPASPPSYPASYDNVVAVTAVDKRNRALIEAGRALHLDYAAPGADIYGHDAQGGMTKLRGTSFASPLVAARLAAAIERGNWRTRLDNEARDLGKKGPDRTFGRGLVCDLCRPQK